MRITFYKYQGTGNDFILIDNRDFRPDIDTPHIINKLCDRKFGIGADGLMLLQHYPTKDFEMRYFNADGLEATMCGNGGRCIAAFANKLGIIGAKAQFWASDGMHEAHLLENDMVNLKMQNVSKIKQEGPYVFLDTGSPHYVTFTDNLERTDVFHEGKKIRSNAAFQPGGTNVNFVQLHPDHISVRTYERGVENETLSCGTGVVASAISSALKRHTVTVPVIVHTQGGALEVFFQSNPKGGAGNIWLKGPATFVFKGEITI